MADRVCELSLTRLIVSVKMEEEKRPFHLASNEEIPEMLSVHV
jgi:hypothetical protein